MDILTRKMILAKCFCFLSSKGSFLKERAGLVTQLDARPTSDQEVAGLTLAGLATFFRGD